MSLLGRAPSLVTVANEQVSILVACRLIGMDLPMDEGYGRSMKVRCPFGELYHSDRGVSAAMRVYTDSNSAWCFSCGVYYTPVKLVAQQWDLDWPGAAANLLDRVGYRPVSIAEQWASVVEYDVEPDRAQLADALKTYCRRVIDGWGSRQFDADVSGLLTRCLELLDRVTSEEDAGRWLAVTKEVMTRQFAPEHSLPSDKNPVDS